jgi:sugar lactone lactonase YvrE
MKTITKLIYAASAAAVLAIGAVTANGALAAATVRPTPTPRPPPIPLPLFASIGINFQNSFGSIYEYLGGGIQKILAANLDNPRGVAFDNAGNLFVAMSTLDSVCQCFVGSIVKITPQGVQSPFVTVSINPITDIFLEGVALDQSNNVFVSANIGSFASVTIYKFTPDGVQSTFASQDSLQGYGLAFDSAGNLYTRVSFPGTSPSPTPTPSPSQILKYAPDGTSSVFATASSLSYSFNSFAFDRFGNLFVSTESNGMEPDTILKFTPDGTQSTFATGLSYPRGLAFDSAGNLFVVEVFTNGIGSPGDILKFTPAAIRSVFASGISNPEFLAFPPRRTP